MTGTLLNFEPIKSDDESFKLLFVASLIGSAIGDALGMPFENLAAAKIRKHTRLPIRSYCDAIEGAPCFQFALTRGMYTDDTQAKRACALAIAKHGVLTPAIVADALSGWLFHDSLGQEARYPGITTREAMTRYEESRDPHTCGVNSATCGAAIRILPIALWFCVREPVDLDAEVRQLAKVTHTAPSAQDGAVLVARLVEHAVTGGPITITHLSSSCTSRLMKRSLSSVLRGLKLGTEPDDMAQELGEGTKAHVVVPMAIYHLFRNGFHFQDSLIQALNTSHPSGLDTDSIMSITGGVAGAHFPDEVIRSEWMKDLEDRDLIILEAQRLYDVAAHDGIAVELRKV
jgi:ADP-ribosylglycohydrolase